MKEKTWLEIRLEQTVEEVKRWPEWMRKLEARRHGLPEFPMPSNQEARDGR